jgi:asparagine synthase (glutamine-hydrolysing)
MSVQFGRWNFDGSPVDPQLLGRVADICTKYAPDGQAFLTSGPLAMSFQPFHTTKESLKEHQPATSSSGALLTWDGRLDNRDELIGSLSLPTETLHTDAHLVSTAYERWDTACFAKLTGDWALALWDARKQVLLLAKDIVGARPLFYAFEATHITWSTVLDPLVLLSQRTLQVSEPFVAGYLSAFPSSRLTPFQGIEAVPAGKFLQVKGRRIQESEYWHLDSSQHVHYRSDRDYEQHFRLVFSQAVRRRLRASFPVVAELSGGMDSSSTVCVADQLIADGSVEAPRLDTVSYYDEKEPNWDERPYFSLVERKRGRRGYHIDVGGTEGALLPPEESFFFPAPGCDRLRLAHLRELNSHLQTSNSRVLLSGIGGDEFLGGVPTPIPELQDLFVRFHWPHLLRQLGRFSLQQRRPWMYLCFETLEGFLPSCLRRLRHRPRTLPWFTKQFIARCPEVFRSDAKRLTLFGKRPSFRVSLAAIEHVRRQLSRLHLNAIANHRTTYPYLDRDLLTFLSSIPRGQLVRPGQRRSLMRRALAGLVPPEILARRRKSFVSRRPLALIESASPAIAQLLETPIIVSNGWVDPILLAASLDAARAGTPDHMIPLTKTLGLELWLRTLAIRGDVRTGPLAASESLRGTTSP